MLFLLSRNDYRSMIVKIHLQLQKRGCISTRVKSYNGSGTVARTRHQRHR